jgi:hypothetical protein
VAIVVVIVLLMVTGAIQIPILPGSQNQQSFVTVTRSTCVRPPGFFLIIADLSGFNDSIRHGAPLTPWPVVQVKQGDMVRFLVCNMDSTQAHGFAIQTYFYSGVILAPGDAFRIEFIANLPGTFTFYCNIFCTVHVFMVGRLIVSS